MNVIKPDNLQKCYKLHTFCLLRHGDFDILWVSYIRDKKAISKVRKRGIECWNFCLEKLKWKWRTEIKVTLSQTNCCRGTVQPWKWQLIGTGCSTAAQASGRPLPALTDFGPAVMQRDRRTTPHSAISGLHPVAYTRWKLLIFSRLSLMRRFTAHWRTGSSGREHTLTSRSSNVTWSVLEKCPANSGYISRMSSRSSRWILCRSQ